MSCLVDVALAAGIDADSPPPTAVLMDEDVDGVLPPPANLAADMAERVKGPVCCC